MVWMITLRSNLYAWVGSIIDERKYRQFGKNAGYLQITVMLRLERLVP